MPITIDGGLGVTFPSGNRQSEASQFVHPAYNMLHNPTFRVATGPGIVGQRGIIRPGTTAVLVTGNNVILQRRQVIDRWYATTELSGTAAANFGQDINPNLSNGRTGSLLVAVSTAAGAEANKLLLLSQAIEGNDFQQAKFGSALARSISWQFEALPTFTGRLHLAFKNSANNRTMIVPVQVTAGVWNRLSGTIPADTAGTWLSDNGIGLEVSLVLNGSGAYSAPAEQVNVWFSHSADVNNRTPFAGPGQFDFMASTANQIRVTAFQIEANETPTLFNQLSIADEHRVCERYFEVGSAKVFQSASATATVGVNYRTVKRASPSLAIANVFQTAVGRQFVPTAVEWSEPQSFGVNRNTNNEIAFEYLIDAGLTKASGAL